MTAQNSNLEISDKKIRIAYLDEPPFYWTEGEIIRGSDIELAKIVLNKIGITDIEYVHTTFAELLPGVKAGKWDINVPIFVTEERSKDVTFSIPVWALGDGFVVHKDNPKNLKSYEDIAKQKDAKLGLIPGTVQIDAAKMAGVSESQILLFSNQPLIIEALKTGKIDAFAATALGNTSIAEANSELESIPHENNNNGNSPVGAFSFNKNNVELIKAFNEQLKKYLGTEHHRKLVAPFGITKNEIDSIVP